MGQKSVDSRDPRLEQNCSAVVKRPWQWALRRVQLLAIGTFLLLQPGCMCGCTHEAPSAKSTASTNSASGCCHDVTTNGEETRDSRMDCACRLFRYVGS